MEPSDNLTLNRDIDGGTIYTTESTLDEAFYMSMEREENMKIVYMAISLFGIPGNILTLVAILTSQKMRGKPFNMLIVHQSWIDLCCCLCAFCVQVVSPSYNGTLGKFVCHIWSSMYALWVFFIASSYNLTAIAIERYLAITRPLHYDESRALKRMPLLFGIVWLCGFVLILPEALLAKVVNSECVLYYELAYKYQVALNIFYSCISSILPLIVMIFCYANIVKCLRASSKLSTSKSTGGADMRRAEIRIIQSTAILSAFFLATYCYLYAIQYGYMFFDIELYPQYHISIALIIMNSCINPYVYCLRYDDFQQRIKQMLCGCCQQNEKNKD